MKNTVSTIRQQKENGDRITMLTCYDYSTAKLMDQAGINSLLIGDSLGMVMLGYTDTLSVTVEDILHHTKAVARGAENALIVADMPFLSYHISAEQAVENAGRMIKEGRAQSVKLEGGASVCKQIRAITGAQIPVMAHLGLTPQSINAFGGFKVQGKSADAAKELILDALRVQEAGAFAVVLEAIPAKIAEIITSKLDIPTIGIGAGAGCDGQVLVYQDMLDMYGNMKPKFAKVFGEVGAAMTSAFTGYIDDVKRGIFPAEEHSFASNLSDDELDELRKL